MNSSSANQNSFLDGVLKPPISTMMLSANRTEPLGSWNTGMFFESHSITWLYTNLKSCMIGYTKLIAAVNFKGDQDEKSHLFKYFQTIKNKRA